MTTYLTDETLRRYLLGQVSEEEGKQIEDLFLTDAQFNERMEIAENELIDAYIDAELSADDERRFTDRFAQTEKQRQRIRIAAAVKKEAKKSLGKGWER